MSITQRCLGIGDRLCPVCGLAQDQEAALNQAKKAEDAMSLMEGLDVLSAQSPELRELRDKMQALVEKLLEKKN